MSASPSGSRWPCSPPTPSPRPPMPPRRSCWCWCSPGRRPSGWPCRSRSPSAGCWPSWCCRIGRSSTPTPRLAGPVVSRDNFGGLVASIAGSALIIDYILTVAVSVSAGTAALTSAFHVLEPWRVLIAVSFVVLLAWGNLRGLRESRRIFAVPTYLYVAGMGTVVVLGIWGWAFGDLGPIHYSPAEARQLAGVRRGAGPGLAVSHPARLLGRGDRPHRGGGDLQRGVGLQGTPGPQRPHHPGRHGRHHGVPVHRHHLPGHPLRAPAPSPTTTLVCWPAACSTTVPSSPSRSPLLILVLAAGLVLQLPAAGLLRRRRRHPARQLRKRGHRLVYSNGILVLSAAAVFLVVTFEADTHHLIPLYAIGVVTSFTLSQSGMADGICAARARLAQGPGDQRHRRPHHPGRPGRDRHHQVRRRRLDGLHRHPGPGAAAPAGPADLPVRGDPAQGRGVQRLAPPKPRHEVVVLLEDLDQAAIGALQYARQLNPLSITALHVAVDPDHARSWPAGPR